jgi:hypothetical protein
LLEKTKKPTVKSAPISSTSRVTSAAIPSTSRVTTAAIPSTSQTSSVESVSALAVSDSDLHVDPFLQYPEKKFQIKNDKSDLSPQGMSSKALGSSSLSLSAVSKTKVESGKKTCVKQVGETDAVRLSNLEREVKKTKVQANADAKARAGTNEKEDSKADVEAKVKAVSVAVEIRSPLHAVIHRELDRLLSPQERDALRALLVFCVFIILLASLGILNLL